MDDIIELLTSDHRELKAMLRTLIASKPSPQSDEMFQRLYHAIKVHAKFEEIAVYPLLVKDPSSHIKALEGYEEHAQITVLLEALATLPSQDPTHLAKLNVLNEDLTHHIVEEEGILFPRLCKIASSVKLAVLAESYLEIKEHQFAKTVP